MARRRRNHQNGRQAIFIDAGYCVALLHIRDQYHGPAQRWQRYLEDGTDRLITTEAVLWEWLDGCSQSAIRRQAAEGYRLFHEDDRIMVIAYEPPLMQAAFRLYEARPDKGRSLTDCLSFVVMQQQGITDALTADHHFEQAGFRALLLSDPPS